MELPALTEYPDMTDAQIVYWIGVLKRKFPDVTDPTYKEHIIMIYCVRGVRQAELHLAKEKAMIADKLDRVKNGTSFFDQVKK